MNNFLNLTIVEGNLTRNPELLYTKNGKSVCKFDIAVNFRYKQNEKEYNEVSYISVTLWNKIAEICAKYLKKGSFVRVKGRLKQDFWIGKDGIKRYKLFIEGEAVDFLGSRKKEKVIEKVPF